MTEKFIGLKNMAASIFTIASRSNTQDFHQHNVGQLSVPQNGTIYLVANNQLFIIPPSMAIFIPKNIEHCVYKVSKNTIIENIYFKDNFKKFLPQSPQTFSLSLLAKTLISKLCTINDDMLNSPKVINILNVLLDELGEEINKISYLVQMPHNAGLKKVFALLTHSFDYLPTLIEAANAINVSSRTLQRMIKDDLGISFILWRQQIIFAKALELLYSHNKTSNIAYKLGYNSESSFIAMFKKMSGGKSPSKFFSTIKQTV